MRDRRVLIFDVGTLAQRRTIARRHAAAISLALGLWAPRSPAASEITQVGGGRHVPREQLVWRLYARPVLIAAGPLAGAFRLMVRIDDPAVAALHGQTLPVPAALGGGTVGPLNLLGAVAAAADHDGDEEDFS